jgi:cation diffusion facilitator CzcD-associated flavoprotein CzcO
MHIEYVDVLIVGAGLSGIGQAYHLQKKCPQKTYAILEAREDLGGTWDLFRYPGIRSDSDMYTLGFVFKPWIDKQSIADGPSIMKYLRETAAEYHIDEKIRFGHRVTSASWSSSEALWTVDVEQGVEKNPLQIRCNFISTCCGYYNYERGYIPDFEGLDQYQGQFIEPQFWPEDLDYKNKEVIVIGSGATAVTIVPEMAKQTHVTMLQRSPTYMVTAPNIDAFAQKLHKWLPTWLAYSLMRTRNVLLTYFIFNMSKKYPQRVKNFLLGQVRKQLKSGVDVDKHFTPRYNPWEERLCAVLDGDIFKAINEGRVDMVTDHIDRFTREGIKLKSGDELKADIVVSATGLDLQLMGGLQLTVDGEVINPAEGMNYKGFMFSNIPNLSATFGYTNASWTLKADLTSAYVCRMLNYMDKKQVQQCRPVNNDPDIQCEDFLDFKSGYIQRAIHKFPKMGNKKPWRLDQNYFKDMRSLGFGKVNDGVMQFSIKRALANQENNNDRKTG